MPTSRTHHTTAHVTPAATLLALAGALPDFVARFDGFVAQDIGPRLSCSEAEALAAVLTAAGAAELAAYWLAAHGEGDEPNNEPGTMGDRHRHLFDAMIAKLPAD